MQVYVYEDYNVGVSHVYDSYDKAKKESMRRIIEYGQQYIQQNKDCLSATTIERVFDELQWFVDSMDEVINKNNASIDDYAYVYSMEIE